MNIQRTESHGVIDIKLSDENGQIGFGTGVVDDGELSIDRISVQEKHRGQGRAGVIENKMEEVARNIGASTATTFIAPNNQASQKVHEKGGYQMETKSGGRGERSKKL